MSATALSKYQNVSASQLFEFLATNPNRNLSLTPIESTYAIQLSKEEDEEHTLEALNLPQFTSTAMNPSNVLGIFHWIADPMYGLSLPNSRAAMLREFATALQEKTEHLQGTSLARKRKKLHDWISAMIGSNTIKEEDWNDFYSAMATMQEVQLILVRRQTTEEGEEVVGSGYKGEISFATNPTLWTASKPVYVADYRGRWMATPVDTAGYLSGPVVSIWLGSLESSGWTVEWPEADGTKESIVNELNKLPTWNATDSKLKKEVLAKRLGKAHTFNALRS
jgi:pterin-4a-carbinolamine dehydratase